MAISNFCLCLPWIDLKVMEWCEWIEDIVEGFRVEVVCRKKLTKAFQNIDMYQANRGYVQVTVMIWVKMGKVGEHSNWPLAPYSWVEILVTNPWRLRNGMDLTGMLKKGRKHFSSQWFTYLGSYTQSQFSCTLISSINGCKHDRVARRHHCRLLLFWVLILTFLLDFWKT